MSAATRQQRVDMKPRAGLLLCSIVLKLVLSGLCWCCSACWGIFLFRQVNSPTPFAGEGFNVGSGSGIICASSRNWGLSPLAHHLLIIAGEFDLSIGSMIGFAGACMAMILRWGFAIVIPYLSFDGGVHIEFFTLFYISDVSPIGAIFITMCFTLFFGWLQGYIVVRSWACRLLLSRWAGCFSCEA